MISTLLERLLGRLPIGWLQLTHNRPRFAAALAGVAFANILVLMQLGFLGALIYSISLPYLQMNADLLIVASDMNTLADGSPLPRQRMYEALGVPGIASATALYYGKTDWKLTDGTIRTLDTFGIDPFGHAFRPDEINAFAGMLALSDTALIDRKTRNAPAEILASISTEHPYRFEAKGHALDVMGTIDIGGGFSADGYLVVSDQTFFKMYPQRTGGAPNFILVKLEKGLLAKEMVQTLSQLLPPGDTKVLTIAQAIALDQTFQTTQKPVGLIFGFGIIIGLIVGIIIVYQVLSTDVADHTREYATFKAMGYHNRFFLGIVFEEAMILGILGFVPGVVIALGLYSAISAATGLPLIMPVSRAAMVFFGTIAMCTLSGAIATRRLARANPADLF